MTRPLLTLLLTRPRAASERLAQELLGRDIPDHDLIISPLIGIAPVGGLVELTGLAAVIFTSGYAVTSAKFAGPVEGRRAYCVGHRTAALARDRGFDSVSAEGNAADLVDLILAHPPDGPLLHLSGDVTVGDVPARLGAAGLRCRQEVVYRQIQEVLSGDAKERLGGTGRVVVPLFSPNTAKGFAAQGPYGAAVETVAMSDAVENALLDLPRAAAVMANSPDMSAMINAISSTLGGN